MGKTILEPQFEIEGSIEPGLTSFYETIKNDIDEEQLVVKLMEYSIDSNIPQPDEKGGQLIEIYRSIVNRLNGRVLIEDLGIKENSFEWFAFHTPPDCKGSIKWSKEKLSEGEFGVTIFGSGLGGSAKIKLINAQQIDECTSCQTFLQHIDVRIRKYGYKNGDKVEKEELVVEPVKWRHLEIKSDQRCPYCSLSHDQIDEFKYDLLDEQALDLRASNVGITREWSREVVYDEQASIGLKLFKDVAEIKLKVKKTGALKAEVSWKMKPGKFYKPYVNMDNTYALPYWTIT